jgi:hypothetical protein
VLGVQVEMAAVHDLLFSQCDRHPQNVIINADGNLKLIDNDQAYRFGWRRWGPSRAQPRGHVVPCAMSVRNVVAVCVVGAISLINVQH